MADVREVTTPCPRCGQPIVWARRAPAVASALAVVGWRCFCNLTTAEWSALAVQVSTTLVDAE
jgi:hypothetical protein